VQSRKRIKKVRWKFSFIEFVEVAIVRQLLASGEAQIGIMWSNTPPQIETEGNV